MEDVFCSNNCDPNLTILEAFHPYDSTSNLINLDLMSNTVVQVSNNIQDVSGLRLTHAYYQNY